MKLYPVVISRHRQKIRKIFEASASASCMIIPGLIMASYQASDHDIENYNRARDILQRTPHFSQEQQHDLAMITSILHRSPEYFRYIKPVLSHLGDPGNRVCAPASPANHGEAPRIPKRKLAMSTDDECQIIDIQDDSSDTRSSVAPRRVPTPVRKSFSSHEFNR